MFLFSFPAVNAASGVKTPFGGIITSIIVIAACAFLTPYFAYIPTTAVAAVIIAAMIFTLELEIILPIWKSKSNLFYIINMETLAKRVDQNKTIERKKPFRKV